jgi:hypothetical protein
VRIVAFFKRLWKRWRCPHETILILRYPRRRCLDCGFEYRKKGF